MTVSPVRGGCGKRKCTALRSGGISMRSIFSSAFTRLWTALAFVFL